ncbi:hypothetical protein niasHT_019768 [Heterodera trifolii]|uniref:Uncharacterized protein n=1 Tax=Heterodera trifolii TaxID=157864 RepID=A0ABD2LEF6_9BILA
MDMDKILSDMRQHISNLQDKLHVANSAVSKGQIVNEKITLMKEYQDKIASLNSCWRARNRTQLVHNLQQESRQIIALEEENRQLRFALKEMEDGLHLIMNDYRKMFSGFMRGEELAELANAQHKKVFLAGVSYEQYFGIARAAEKFMAISENKVAEDDQVITQLKLENQTLRALFHGFSLPSTKQPQISTSKMQQNCLNNCDPSSNGDNLKAVKKATEMN